MPSCGLCDGLELPDNTIVELDTDDLLRMDKATFIDMLSKAVGGTVMTPNAAMKELNQPPVEGGDSLYMQQQNYSLSALARRDAQPDPFNPSAPVAAPEPKETIEDIDADELEALLNE